jgi:hypothetical protein
MQEAVKLQVEWLLWFSTSTAAAAVVSNNIDAIEKFLPQNHQP